MLGRRLAASSAWTSAAGKAINKAAKKSFNFMDEFPIYCSRIIYPEEMIGRQLPDNRLIVAGSSAPSPTGRPAFNQQA